MKKIIDWIKSNWKSVLANLLTLGFNWVISKLKSKKTKEQ